MSSEWTESSRLTFQNHLEQRTLLDHFLVVRSPTPAPTISKPENPSHDEPESQIDVLHTGTAEPSSVEAHAEHSKGMVHVASSPLDCSQDSANLDIGALAMRNGLPYVDIVHSAQPRRVLSRRRTRSSL